MWSRQERTICRTQALTGVLTFSAPTISATISKPVLSPSPSASRVFSEQLVDLPARLGDLGLGVAEGAAVAGQAEVDLERLDLVEAAEELADRVGAVAVVEEEDGAAEQVVAGDHQLALGLVQDDVRGRVAGRLVDLPGAEVGLHLDPGQQVAVGLDDRVDAVVVVVLAGLAVAFERRRPARRSAAPPRAAAPAPPPGRRRAGARAPRPGASRARSRRPRRSAPPARSGRCGSGCRRAASRPRGRSRPGRGRGRTGASGPCRRCRCRRGRCRRRRRPPRRCRGARPARAAASRSRQIARQDLLAARRLGPLALVRHRANPLRRGAIRA